MPVCLRECFWRVLWGKISCDYRPDNWNEFHDHETDFNGDENQINGEEYDFNGDENQINGEEMHFHGDENQFIGEENDFNGEENAFSWWWKLVILFVINKLSLGQENHGKWGYILKACQCVFFSN